MGRLLPLVVLLSACSGLFDELTEDTDVVSVLPAPEGSPIATVPMTTAPAPLPPGARGELPRFEALRPIERSGVQIQACQGADAALIDRLIARIDADSAADRTSPWGDLLLDDCRQPSAATCRIIGERVEGASEVGPGLFALWHVAGGCADPGVWRWMNGDEGPLVGMADYLAVQDNLWRPVADPEVPALMAPLLTSDALHRAAALQALGAVDDPKAARLLLDHREGLPTLEEQDAVALWLYRQSDPDARRHFADVCASKPQSWQCLEGLDPLSDLDGVLRAGNVDFSAVLERHPGHRAAVIEALRECVRSGARGEHIQGGRCLRVLVGAGEDPTALIERLDPDDLEVSWVARRKAWLELGGRETGSALVARGLLPEDLTVLDPSEPPVYVVDWFLEANRGVSVEGRSNAQALTELLGQVPGLSDAVVRVRGPFGGDGPEPLQELFVWLSGTRYRALAAPWEDDRHLAAFANGVAEAAGVDTRFVVVAPGQVIVWGEQEALTKLVEDGLLDVLE